MNFYRVHGGFFHPDRTVESLNDSKRTPCSVGGIFGPRIHAALVPIPILYIIAEGRFGSRSSAFLRSFAKRPAVLRNLCRFRAMMMINSAIRFGSISCEERIRMCFCKTQKTRWFLSLRIAALGGSQRRRVLAVDTGNAIVSHLFGMRVGVFQGRPRIEGWRNRCRGL